MVTAQGWASECPDVKNYKWQLSPVWHRMLCSCIHLATVVVKGLRLSLVVNSAKDVATRQRYVRLVDGVREAAGIVRIFSSLHVSGERECNNCSLSVMLAQSIWSDFIRDMTFHLAPVLFVCLRPKYGTRWLFTSANPKHTFLSDIILRHTTFSQSIVPNSGPHDVPWFSSETLILTLTYFLAQAAMTFYIMVNKKWLCNYWW